MHFYKTDVHAILLSGELTTKFLFYSITLFKMFPTEKSAGLSRDREIVEQD